MNKKQKRILGILALAFSVLLVVTIASTVPWTFVVNGGDSSYTEVPTAPELNSVPSPNIDGSVELSWSQPDQTQYFELYRYRWGWYYVAKLYTTSYTDVHVADGATYKYKVVAGNTLGKSPDSNVVSVLIDLYEEDGDAIPDAPVLRLMTNSPSIDGEIDLEWDLVSGATMYTIFRWKGGINPEILKQDFSENYYDDSVSSNGVYSYKVKAGNDVGYSDYSNEISITVQMAEVPDVPVMNQLEFEIINYTVKVYIDWDAVDCDSYVLYRSFNGEIYKPVEGILSTSSTIYAEILTEAGTYVYKVSAVNTYGESGLSNSVTIEVTEDGGVAPPTDYTTLYVLLGILVVLIVPIAIILVKRKKR